MSPWPVCPPGTHCVTCSDEAIPMRVIGQETGGLAECMDDTGRCLEVETALVTPVRTGDVVLVHGGTALSRVAPHPTEQA